MKYTTFQNDLKRGRSMEDIVDNYFISKGVNIVKIPVKKEIDCGYDRVYEFNDSIYTVEIKHDAFSCKSGNFYLEWEIMNPSGKQKDGWVQHTQADRIMIYGGKKDSEGLYIISNENLHKGFDEFQTYPYRKSIVTKGGNKEWWAMGYTVEVSAFNKYCHKFISEGEINAR